MIHDPVLTAPAGKPIAIAAKALDPAGVKWVRLRYRSFNQHRDSRTLALVPTGDEDLYRGIIQTPYIVVKLQR